MAVTMRVEGLSEIRDALLELPRATSKRVMQRVLMKRAQPIADQAKTLVPVESGDLKRSIKVATRLSRRQRRFALETKSYAEVYVGAGPLPHAHLVEFGSVHNQPVPYMRPAWDSNKGRLLIGIRDDLWTEIERVIARMGRKGAR